MGLFGGSSTPSYNREESARLRDLSTDVGTRLGELQTQYNDWFTQQQAENDRLMQNVIGRQLQAMNQQMWQADRMFDMGKFGHKQWKQQFKPFLDDLRREAKSYNTTERRQREMGSAISGVGQAFAAERRNQQQRLEDFGIDPSDTRAKALDRDVSIAEAAAKAQAGYQAGQNVENTARQLRSDVIQSGDALQNRAMQYSQLGGNLQQGAAQIGMNPVIADRARMDFNNQGYLNQGRILGQEGQTYGQSHNMLNQQFMGRLGAHGQQIQPGQALLGVGSAIGGAWAGSDAGGGFINDALGSLFSEGGAVPTPEELGQTPAPTPPMNPTDTVRAQLTPGEFVIPEEAVRWKGEEYLERIMYPLCCCLLTRGPSQRFVQLHQMKVCDIPTRKWEWFF